MKITARFTFESAHRLYDESLTEKENADLFGPCATTHGHTYLLELSLEGEELRSGMLFNFSDLNTLVQSRIVGILDHGFINDVPDFSTRPTTAEELALWVWRQLDPHIRGGAHLAEVTVHEGERFSATVSRSDAV